MVLVHLIKVHLKIHQQWHTTKEQNRARRFHQSHRFRFLHNQQDDIIIAFMGEIENKHDQRK